MPPAIQPGTKLPRKPCEACLKKRAALKAAAKKLVPSILKGKSK